MQNGNYRLYYLYMMVDVDELVLLDDPHTAGDTFIFEPSAVEEGLGRLFAAVEVEEKGGIGREMIDTVVNALQREYYRDPTRGMLASLESALHQANLVLHEMSEQGARDWMGSWHAAVGALAKKTLHVSTAGDGVVLLARGNRLTSVSAGLSHSPVTDPLRTFAQVASGVVSSGDVLLVGTSQLEVVFRPEDVLRLTVQKSAATIATRLRQLYEDQRMAVPLASLVVSLVSEQAAQTAQIPMSDSRIPINDRPTPLSPRKPLTIHRSFLKRVLLLLGRMISYGWRMLRGKVWPLVKSGSRRGGGALFEASRSAGKNVKSLTQRGAPVVRDMPHRVNLGALKGWFGRLPTSSRVFMVVVLVLAVALSVSLILLQQKRATDAQFEHASELLHEARTKAEAAQTALIYDNRDQARTLLDEAEDLAAQISALELYEEQITELTGEITEVQDRLDKVTRASGEAVREVGDFAGAVGGRELEQRFYLQGELYSFSAKDNTIAKLDESGVASVVSRTTQGIGFFSVGASHEADKALVLMTDSPGAALFDAKTEVVQRQDISLPAADPEIKAVATFGSRIYMYDAATDNVYGYSKTLRGYSGGNAWITDEGFSRDSIVDIGVDGYIYTLHEDGSVNKLLKGAPVDFSLEQVDPPLPGSAKLVVSENLGHLYIFDEAQKRIVIFDTVGNLSRQIFLGEDTNPKDIAIDPEENTLYVLDGTKVLGVSLRE